MKKFHLALAVNNLTKSIEDYSVRLGEKPCVIVPEKYALWRTETLNISISQLPEQAGQLRHLGFEDENADAFSHEIDVNGIKWERFAFTQQRAEIQAIYGE